MKKNKLDKLTPKQTWQKIFEYSYKYKFELIASAILTLPEVLVSIIGPKISGKLMDIISKGAKSALSGGSIDFYNMAKILAFLFVLYSSFLVCSSISSYLTSKASVRLTYRLRKEISEKINRLPIKYFNKETYGEVTSKITNDVDILVSSLTGILSRIISSTAILLGILYMMVSISWEMSLVSFLGTPLGLILMVLIINSTQKYFKKYQEQLGKMNGHIEEMYSGHNVIKAFNGERMAIKKFDKLNSEMYNLEWKSSFFSSFISPIMEFISSLVYIALCVMGGYFAMVQKISVGNIFAFLTYSNQFMKPLTSVMGISGTLQQIYSAAQRVFEFLEEAEESPNSLTEHLEKLSPGHFKGKNGEQIEIKGGIEFKHVVFAYEGEIFGVKDFTLSVKPGQTIAIVGPNGAGKTTLAKILAGFYTLQSGSIFIDGYDIRKFKKEDLHSLFGFVFQEPWLFNGTILENIKYGKMESCDEDVKKAAELACASSFIEALPEGYETLINESSDNISQGEKQLLTIARAILAGHKMLILDEATASIDTRTENKIQQGLKELLNGKTSFIIAHRLSTIRSADLIVVMNNGKIAEQGTHKELIEKKGIYYNMYILQFKNEVLE